MSKKVKSVTLNIGHDHTVREQAISTTYDLNKLGYEVVSENQFITACTFNTPEKMTIECAENVGNTQRTNVLRVKYDGEILSDVTMTVNQQPDPGSDGYFIWTTTGGDIGWVGGNIRNSYTTSYWETIKFSRNDDLYEIINSSTAFNVYIKKNENTTPRTIEINAYTGATEETGKIVGTWTITQDAMPSDFYFNWVGDPNSDITRTVNASFTNFQIQFTSNYEAIYSNLSQSCFFTQSYAYEPDKTSPLTLSFSQNDAGQRSGTISFYSDEGLTHKIASLKLTQNASSGEYFILGNDDSSVYETYAHVSGGTVVIPLSTTYEVSNITWKCDPSNGFNDPTDSGKRTHNGEFFLTGRTDSVRIFNDRVEIDVDESYYRYPLSRDVPRGMTITFHNGNSEVEIGRVILKQVYYYTSGYANYVPIPANYLVSVAYMYTNIPKLMRAMEGNRLYPQTQEGYSFYADTGIVTNIETSVVGSESFTEIDGITKCESIRIKITHGENTDTTNERTISCGIDGVRTRRLDSRQPSSGEYTQLEVGKYYTMYQNLFRFSQEHAGPKELLVDFFEEEYSTPIDKIAHFDGKTVINSTDYTNKIGKLDWDLYPKKDKNGNDLNIKYFHFLVKSNYFLTSPELSLRVFDGDTATDYYDRNYPVAGILGDGGYNMDTTPETVENVIQAKTYDNGIKDPDNPNFAFDPRRVADAHDVEGEQVKIYYERIGYEQTPGVDERGFSYSRYYLSFEPVNDSHTAQTTITAVTIEPGQTTVRIPIYTNVPRWHTYDYDTVYYSGGTNCTSVKIVKDNVVKEGDVLKIKPELLIEGITGDGEAKIFTHTHNGGTPSGHYDKQASEQRLAISIQTSRG